ncbi:MAG: DUF1080 domain-containing protein, partial [Isosphaeraceae bacterium]
MNNINLRIIAALTPCLVATILGADAPDAKPTKDAPKVLVLFDGKGLDGWKATTFHKPGEVKVEDGAIILEVGNPMTGITTTRTDLPTTNYELSYQARRLKGQDFFAAATFPVNKSFLTLVNGGWGGNVTGVSSIDGADASENQTGTYIKYQDQTWYSFRIRVTANVVRCWVDGKEVVDADIEGRELGTRIESRASQPLGFASWET